MAVAVCTDRVAGVRTIAKGAKINRSALPAHPGMRGRKGNMREGIFLGASALLAAGMTPQTGAAHPMQVTTSPADGAGPPAAIYIARSGPSDPAAARDLATVIYHADRPGDMETWLFERLMDRYSRAFDLNDALSDPALDKAVDVARSSIRARLQSIADRHAPILFQAGVAYFTYNYSGNELHAMLTFARSDAGRKYFYWQNLPYLDDRAAAGMLADNSRLADDIVSELRAAAPETMAHHPELARAVIIAGGALR